MKKIILSVSFLVVGFLFFAYFHITDIRNPNNLTFLFGSVLIITGLVLGFIGLRKDSVLPIIAANFSFAPILLICLGWMIPYIGNIFWYLFFMSGWGLGFCIIGLVIGIISLCIEVKKKRKGMIISIAAIIAPFLWVLYLYLYHVSGGELFL